jgi:plasmid stabilization system protein ParE
MVNRGIQQLRRRVFPPDPATASRLQARFLDTSLAQGVRREALAELIELRQKAPESMDPDLIRAIITDAIANASDPSQRAQLWRALRGQAGSRIVHPMIATLRREADDSVRLELVSTLAAEFSADPAARAELELIAKRDAKMLLRKVAERALSGDAWRDYVVSTVRDASLSAAQRFEPLAWMGETRLTRPADTGMESDLLAVAQKLFDDGDAVALAEVLTRASSGPDRLLGGTLQISMSSLQHPAVADFLIATVSRQPDFSTFSLLGRHRADPRIEAALREMAANHPEAGVRQLAAAQLQPNEQGESR